MSTSSDHHKRPIRSAATPSGPGSAQQTIHWPGLHNQVFLTLYGKSYAANWVFHPLGTGTAILLAAIVTSACVGVGPSRFLGAVALMWRQSRLAILTVVLVVGLAYLMNYSGMNYTLGLGIASAGIFFPMLFAFLGWVAVFLSGSDTEDSNRPPPPTLA